MYVQETFVSKKDIDDEKGSIYGEGDPYEPFTEDIGRLFKELQREHGRCSGKMYIDFTDKSKKDRQIGWIFVKRTKYQDCQDTYLQETWVTLLEQKDCTECGRKGYKYHYLD